MHDSQDFQYKIPKIFNYCIVQKTAPKSQKDFGAASFKSASLFLAVKNGDGHFLYVLGGACVVGVGAYESHRVGARLRPGVFE